MEGGGERPARDWRAEFRLRKRVPASEFRGELWIETESFERHRLRPKGFRKVTDPEFGPAVYAHDPEQERRDDECMAELARFRREQGLLARLLGVFSRRR
jgi:hypothetical protein